MTYNEYTCKSNDRIDLIVFKHYGNIDNLNLVLESNPNLLKKSMNLTGGTVIKLPVISVAENAAAITDEKSVRKPLW